MTGGAGGSWGSRISSAYGTDIPRSGSEGSTTKPGGDSARESITLTRVLPLGSASTSTQAGYSGCPSVRTTRTWVTRPPSSMWIVPSCWVIPRARISPAAPGTLVTVGGRGTGGGGAGFEHPRPSMQRRNSGAYRIMRVSLRAASARQGAPDHGVPAEPLDGVSVLDHRAHLRCEGARGGYDGGGGGTRSPSRSTHWASE